MRGTGNRRFYSVLALCLAGVVTAVAALAGSAHTNRAAVRGHMTPALGAQPKWELIGSSSPTAPSPPFGCQSFTPPNGPCYVPNTIAAAYSIQPLFDKGFNGAGSTIVIIDAYGSSTISSDLATFDTRMGLPAPSSFSQVAPFGIDPTSFGNLLGWSGETTLDVEWSHAVAPGANIKLVIAKSNNDADILAATKYVLDNNLGDVVSQSFGEAEQCVDPTLLGQEHAIFDAMSAKGITLFASSGDSGSDQSTCDGTSQFQAASSPASDPDVTAVGGTTLLANGTTGAYQSETTWNDSFGAGGGGVSVVYGRPDFQSPVVKDFKMRAEPDVAYNAAVLNGVVTAWQEEGLHPPGTFFRFGGTSAGSPQWAGLIAIADQMAGGRVGNINKTLYHLGKKSQGTYFHDIADGSNNGAFSATPGYDEATGWGSPIASALVPAIAKPGNG